MQLKITNNCNLKSEKVEQGKRKETYSCMYTVKNKQIHKII